MGDDRKSPGRAETAKLIAKAVAPFGLVGRALGFRWVFPIGTMPIPYHPLLHWGLIVGIPAMIAYELVRSIVGDVGDGQPRWLMPFAAALVLGIPLSIPIVSWAMMVFAAPLLQAMLFAGSMLLLAADIASGRADERLSVLPAAFVLLYFVQAIGGRWQLALLRARADGWKPFDPGEKQVLVSSIAEDEGIRWISDRAITRLALNFGEKERRTFGRRSATCHWIGKDAVAELRGRYGSELPAGWRLSKNDEAPVLVERRVDLDVPTLHWSTRPFRSFLWLVTGELRQARIEGEGISRQLAVGQAKVISWVPFFTLFHWTAIFGGRSEWHVGFARRKHVQVGTSALREAFFTARLGTDVGISDRSLFDRLEQAAVGERAEAEAYFAALEANPGLIDEHNELIRIFDVSSRHLMNGHAPTIVRALTYAKEHRLRSGVWRAAHLLQRLTDDEWQAAKAPIMAVLSSRMLACAWPLTRHTDISDIPKGSPTNGNGREAGFALMRSHIHLYRRLASYGPEGEALLSKLDEAVEQAARSGQPPTDRSAGED